MSHEDIALLTQQLHAARSAEHPDPFEVAGLAGLLARLAPTHADLAREPVASVPRGALEAAARELGDAVEVCDEDSESEVTWDRLAALDELCAAATWLGAPDAVRAAIEDAAAIVGAFPEAWAVHAPLASQLLDRQPPAAEDPAWILWRSVEAAALGVPEADAQAPGASGAVRVAAGLDVVISLAPFRAAARRAAADALPAPARWTSLRDAPDWSAGVTTEDGVVWLIVEAPQALDGGPAVAATCAGAPVHLEPHAGAWRCEAAPGLWTLDGLGATLSFSLSEST